jgi:hypothetical protein
MATNINLTYPNFTLTAQAGTFGSINTSDADTVFRIKNTSGGLISDYTLSSNIHPDNELVGVEYCGPLNLIEMIDNVTFFTVERVPDYDGYGRPLSTSSQCIIKRWETNVGFSTLDLKQQSVKYTTGNYHYDIRGMAVEHYNRTFDFAAPSGQNYIDMSSANKLQAGDTLFLGVSTDTDNPGATEKVTVSFINNDRVFLNGPLFYQYVFGDRITFFNNVYLISEKGYGGDTRYGTIFKHDAYSGVRLEYTTSGEYARIRGARWSTEVGAIAAINKSQLLFIRPYDSYLKWKSMFLSNIDSANKNYFTMYDLVFDQFNIYKLMKKATTKDDAGNKVTESWSTYNYQQDTLLPYTHNVAIHMKLQYTIGPDNTRIYLQTRDQFGVALRDVNINLYDDGSDLGAQFDPINAQGITDKDGKVDIGYIPGGLYTGPTHVRVKADKSSAFTGSQYCWNEILIDGKVEHSTGFGDGSMWLKAWAFSHLGARLLWDPFQTSKNKTRPPGAGNPEVTTPVMYLTGFSQFGAPGGNWVDPSSYSADMAECWPWFQTTPERTDGPTPKIKNSGCVWDCITWPPGPGENEDAKQCPSGDQRYPRSNFITQVLEVTQWGVDPRYYLEDPDDPEHTLGNEARPLRLPQPLDFLQYYKDTLCGGRCLLEEGAPIPHRLFLLDSESWMSFSQLNMSKHSFWVDGSYTPNLTTNVRLDQFIFVEDAVPSFWSEKNPRETDIWIRMRPFAFSLNGDTLKFFVREVWTVDDKHYDTGYYDVIERYGWPPNNNRVTLQYFDAGGGTLGIEFTYDNPDIYHHNALVYVHIEVFDTAAEPNYIYTDYWFRIIPDFNSPYLEAENPDREEDQVALDTKLYFEIKDAGEGVDIDTLEVFLNSRIVYHAGMDYNPDTVIEQVSLNHYKVEIDLPYALQYGKAYSVGVIVNDISENKNLLRDSYRFYTRHSEAPWFTAFDPKLCKRGMPRFRDVSFMVLGAGEGVDEQTVRIQVHEKDVTKQSKITPVIYRIS